MCSLSGSVRFVLSVITVLTFVGVAAGQRQADQEFGPVVTAYLGYLNNEQEVVDDRASRREITPGYYRRNLNRIHALRQTALRLVRQSGNDYVPELEVARRLCRGDAIHLLERVLERALRVRAQL